MPSLRSLILPLPTCVIPGPPLAICRSSRVVHQVVAAVVGDFVAVQQRLKGRIRHAFEKEAVDDRVPLVVEVDDLVPQVVIDQVPLRASV